MSRGSSSPARPVSAQPHKLHDQALEPEPLRERRDQHDPGVRHHAIVVKHDTDTVKSDRRAILHHESDLLTQDAAIFRASRADLP